MARPKFSFFCDIFRCLITNFDNYINIYHNIKALVPDDPLIYVCSVDI